MIWKLLGLQKKLDALFDDGWGCIGLSAERSSPSVALAGAVHSAQARS